MLKKHVFFDKTEVVVAFPEKKKFKSLNLTFDKITRIQIDKCTETRFLRKIPSEKIIIVTSKNGNPIEYIKTKEKHFYEEYKQGFIKFAKDNHITFINNT